MRTFLSLIFSVFILTACGGTNSAKSDSVQTSSNTIEEKVEAEKAILAKYLGKSTAATALAEVQAIKYDNPNQLEADRDAVFLKYMSRAQLDKMDLELSALWGR